jgi:phenylalanine ammonia-lyase
MNCGLQDDSLYNAQRGLPTVDKASIGSSVSIIYENLLKVGMTDMILKGSMQDKK